MSSTSPIGVFDSGIGGLTVVKEILSLHPNERIIYFGDTARVPYGSKSIETVRRYALEDTELLLEHSPKLIIVACNTVSAVALDVVKMTAGEIPVIGMIEPACREALRITKSGRVGVIGTEATVASKAYDTQLAFLANEGARAVATFSKACPLFVPLAEEGWENSAAAELVAKEYLGSIIEANVDTLILGCTHYPVLRKIIQSVMGPNVSLINSGEVASREILLSTISNSSSPEHSYLVSDTPQKFQTIGERFLGVQLDNIKQVIFEETWKVV
ncbi:MAG: glutamate racemase [bacterium]